MLCNNGNNRLPSNRTIQTTPVERHASMNSDIVSRTLGRIQPDRALYKETLLRQKILLISGACSWYAHAGMGTY